MGIICPPADILHNHEPQNSFSGCKPSLLLERRLSQGVNLESTSPENQIQATLMHTFQLLTLYRVWQISVLSAACAVAGRDKPGGVAPDCFDAGSAGSPTPPPTRRHAVGGPEQTGGHASANRPQGTTIHMFICPFILPYILFAPSSLDSTAQPCAVFVQFCSSKFCLSPRVRYVQS